MKFRLIRALAGAAALACAAQAGAQATDWPQHPVRIVVPFQAGSATDLISRQLGAALSTELGQPFVVEARPGAAAAIGSASVARSAPDGYTLLMGAVHHTIATSVYKNLNYDFQKDFAPVTTVALVPNVLVVNPQKNPVADLKELVAQGKAL